MKLFGAMMSELEPEVLEKGLNKMVGITFMCVK
jgi:hypothetical protein